MPTNILQFVPSLEKGGAEKMVLEISKHLNKIPEVNVLIVTINTKNEFPEFNNQVTCVSCNAIVVPSVFHKPIIETSEFDRIIKDFHPDIIHSHLYEAEMVSRWKTVPGVKYISHIHGNYSPLKHFGLNSLFRKKTLANYYERSILLDRYRKCNNHFIAISHDSEMYLQKNLPEDLQRISFLNNAVDVDSYHRPALLEKKTISPEETRLVNAGSFVDNKNQSFLVDTVAVLLKRGYKVKLDLLGDGPDRAKVENKIKEEGLSSQVFCHGIVNNVEDYLHNADIYVHSAFSEAFGLVLLEAMAAGLPVVCLDGKGNRDIMREKYNGFMIPKPDVELFAEKIIQLINDKDLYAHISENAESFAKDYDIKAYVEKLMQIYKVCKKA